MPRAVSIFCLLASLVACGAEPQQRQAPPVEDEAADLPPFSPAPATLHRLTDAAWRNSVRGLLGVGYGGELPIDYRLYGFSNVGASEVSVSPYDLELYESAAWTLAQAVVPDAATRDALVGCSLDVQPGGTDGDLLLERVRGNQCVQRWLTRFLRQAWRRPVLLDEVQLVLGAYTGILADLDDPTLAVQGAIAATLMSPHFLFRVEQGETDPADPARRRYTSVEMASRLSYAILGTAPDERLLAAGERGLLVTDVGLRHHAERLLDQRAATGHLTAFFGEMLDLDRVETMEKNPDLYPDDSPELRDAMVDEVLALFETLALEEDRDLGELYTTRQTWITDPALGRMYGLDLTDDDVPGWFDIPAAQERGGLIGRAAFLAVHAHASQSSPTRRGKALRVRLLCGIVPPPPEGVVTSLEESASEEGSLRDRLEQHATDPACSSCHLLIDPLGYPLERFGALGEWRADDNGYAIDTTGELDGVAVDGAADMGAAMAAHPDLGACFARNLYRFGTGRIEGAGEEAAVVDLGFSFEDSGRRVRDLALALVLSEGFRTTAAPPTDPCLEDQEGATRDCATACGPGQETCQGGMWSGCTAPQPTPERCDGEDNDCDGVTDESVIEACEDEGGTPGVATCDDGAWSDCVTPDPRAETCDGTDEDLDGAIDEDLSVGLEVLTFDELAEDGHPDCDAAADPDGPACRAAVHRYCARQDCYETGIGVVATDTRTERATIACLDSTEGVVLATTFTELSGYHSYCNADRRQGPDCNASINRHCRALGYTTGFGPIENSGDTAYIVCTPEADTSLVTYTTLRAQYAACDGSLRRSGPECNTAFHQYCREAGFQTGHGPLENYHDDSYVACVGRGGAE